MDQSKGAKRFSYTRQFAEKRHIGDTLGNGRYRISEIIPLSLKIFISETEVVGITSKTLFFNLMREDSRKKYGYCSSAYYIPICRTTHMLMRMEGLLQ